VNIPGTHKNKDSDGSVTELAQWFSRRGDLRKVMGASAYSKMRNVADYIKKDIDGGHFIEAYAITDQYVDTVIKYCFPEIFHASKDNDLSKMSVETALRFTVKLKIVGVNILQTYRDFKSTRDDLIHKSIFNQKNTGQLRNNGKVKGLPFQIIEAVEELFHKRVILGYIFYHENGILPPDEHISIWLKIWKGRGIDLKNFLEKIDKLSKK
jgi:hypothetical protein